MHRAHRGRTNGGQMSILGTRVVRTEDPRLLTAGGTYVEDLRVPELAGAARVTFVRSPIAHALITGIDASAAREAPGVVAVLTAADMDDLAPPPAARRRAAGQRGRAAAARRPVRRAAAGRGPGALRRRAGGDGAHRRPLPGRGRRRAGQRGLRRRCPRWWASARRWPTGTLLFPGAGSNVAVDRRHGRRRRAFDGCDVVVERTIVNQRLAPVPLEGRAAAARLGGRQADRLGEHAERADQPVHPGRGARAWTRPPSG